MSVTRMRALATERDLVRLLQMGVVVEEYAEEKSARLLADGVDDDGVREELEDSLAESEEHREKLTELVRRVGAEIDEQHVESLVREAVEREIDAPEDASDALRQQLESERLAYSFYDNVIEACRASDWAEDYDDVVSTLAEIREDELEDAHEIESALQET